MAVSLTVDKTLPQLQAAIEKFAKDRDWDQFHSPKNLAMALSVEASELVELFQWLTEEQSKQLSGEKVGMLRDELADTFIYLLKISRHYNVNLVEAAFSKLEKSALKYPVEKSKGSNKKYTEL